MIRESRSYRSIIWAGDCNLFTTQGCRSAHSRAPSRLHPNRLLDPNRLLVHQAAHLLAHQAALLLAAHLLVVHLVVRLTASLIATYPGRIVCCAWWVLAAQEAVQAAVHLLMDQAGRLLMDQAAHLLMDQADRLLMDQEAVEVREAAVVEA